MAIDGGIPPADGRNRGAADAVEEGVNSSSAVPPPATWYSGSVDRSLRPRRPLSTIALTGARATWHGLMRWTIAGLAGLSALLVATEQHRVCDAWGSCDASDWGPSHTLLADQGGMPLMLLALIAAFQLFGKDSKFLPRVMTAIGAWITSLFVLAGVAFTHFLSHVEGGDGAAFLSFLVMAASLLQIVLEPVLAVRERRALAASEPVFPRAAVVSK